MSKTGKVSTIAGGSQEALRERSRVLGLKDNILENATVYLSGPMDFVASREDEKLYGWRTRITNFLHEFGVRIYDPWNKPPVADYGEIGKEDEFSDKGRENWTYSSDEEGDCKRAEICDAYWLTAHIDLRMTDTADFIIAYCPTNVYSVGTVHEIITATNQHKPVLLVTPPVTFPAREKLRKHLKDNEDNVGSDLLEEVERESPAKANQSGVPSLWYMAIIDGHYFFDGFGFARYMKRFGWKRGQMDEREELYPPQRPLLPYLEQLNRKIPERYDFRLKEYVQNPDWLIFEPGNNG